MNERDDCQQAPIRMEEREEYKRIMGQTGFIELAGDIIEFLFKPIGIAVAFIFKPIGIVFSKLIDIIELVLRPTISLIVIILKGLGTIAAIGLLIAILYFLFGWITSLSVSTLLIILIITLLLK